MMQSVNRLRPTIEVALQKELSKAIEVRQQQISTGRRIERPSDDPAAWAQISNVAKVQANIGAWLKNIDRAESISAQAETAISDINTQLVRVNELVIQASSDALSQDNRETIALELEAIGLQIADFITQDDSYGRPLFEEGVPLEVPIDDNVTVRAAPQRSEFDGLAALMTNIVSTVRTGDQAQRSALLDPLQLEMDNTINVLGQHGIERARLEDSRTRLQERQIDVSEFRASLEETDVTQAITEMQRLLINLEAAQATYARIEQTTLFSQIS